MGDVLFKQGWKWIESQKRALAAVLTAVGFGGGVLDFLDRHRPMECKGIVRLWCFVALLLLQWRECVVRGFQSLFALGPAALFLIIWSLFLSVSTTSSLICVLLSLGAAGVTVCYLGYTSGLFIVGLFGILFMWKYGIIWIVGMLFIVGGYVFSLQHVRILIFLSTSYAIYCVVAHVGWHGILISLNLSFISHELLNKLFQGYDGANPGATCEEHHKESEPLVDVFTEDFESPRRDDFDNVTTNQSPYKAPGSSSFSAILKDVSSIKFVKSDASSLDEMKRIMNSPNHYEALGVPRNKSIDVIFLKKEYHKKARLVHPDKNMGNPLASESFKKLQCAYEVLTDLTKKMYYDEQLRNEESGNVYGKSYAHTQQNGVDYRPEESRRIECTKCGHSHIWICTNRCKIRSRWCQDCSMYHPAKDGDGWVESMCSTFNASQKVKIPRAFVCAESKIFDVSEWAICQGMICKPNTHRPSFHVNMVGFDTTLPRSPSRFSWGLDAQMLPEDEFEVWLQHALAAGLFSETLKQRCKSWSPFKITQKGSKTWRRSP